jgi:hypothetical protein
MARAAASCFVMPAISVPPMRTDPSERHNLRRRLRLPTVSVSSASASEGGLTACVSLQALALPWMSEGVDEVARPLVASGTVLLNPRCKVGATRSAVGKCQHRGGQHRHNAGAFEHFPRFGQCDLQISVRT